MGISNLCFAADIQISIPVDSTGVMINSLASSLGRPETTVYTYVKSYVGTYPDSSQNPCATAGGMLSAFPAGTDIAHQFFGQVGTCSNTPSDGNHWIGVNIGDGNVYYALFTVSQGGTFITYDPTGLNPGTSTFIEPYSPTHGSFSSTNPQIFSAPYFLDCSVDFGAETFSFRFADTTTGNHFTIESPSTPQCGNGTASSSVTLTLGHEYLWQPVMTFLSGNEVVGLYYSYFATSTLPATYTGATFGTSTISLTTSFIDFINVPSLLKTKVPFGYIYQFASIITSSFASSSATTIPSGSFSVHFPAGTTTIDMFSTSTISHFISPSMLALIRGFMVAITYFSFGWFVFHEAKRKTHLS